MMLDLDSVRLFVLVADFGNLTRAAAVAGTVQPVVSQRLKALEASVGRRLLDRTPRFVRLTADGESFLGHARALLSAHDAALQFANVPPVRFALGASDHALGLGISAVLRQVRAVLPVHVLIEVRTGMSQTIHEMFDAGQLDAALIRREAGGPEGEVLGNDHLGWRVPYDWTLPAHVPLPLATLGPPCGVHAVAVRSLERDKRPWREALIAGSCAALLAGVQAGLGVAPMGRIASGDMPDAGPRLGLPALPESEIVLLARATSPEVSSAIRALATAVQSQLNRRN